MRSLGKIALISVCLFFQSFSALGKSAACDTGFYSLGKENLQKALKNYDSCLKGKGITPSSQIALSQVQSFDKNCRLSRDQTLEAKHDLNAALENGFWLDLASKSHQQANCRIDFFNQYFEKPTQKQKLNAKAAEHFEQHQERLAALGHYRAKLSKDRQDWQNAANANRGLGSERVKGLDTLIGSVDKEIATYLAKIPLGYEPEVGARLMAMAMTGTFDEMSFAAGMFEATEKYKKTTQFYSDRRIQDKQGEGNYCLDVNYKNFAASSGQTDTLVDSYKFLSKKEKGILQCRVNSVYKVGADRLSTGMTGAFVVGGVLAAVPTGGGSLGVSLSAVGVVTSVVGFVDQLDQARQKCALSTYIVSGQQGKCNPEQDFNNAVDSSTMGSCLANIGLAAVGAVEIPVNFVQLARAVKLKTATKVVPEKAVAEEAIEEAPVEEIVVTAPRKKKKPASVSSARTQTKSVDANSNMTRNQFTSENLKRGLTTKKQNVRWVKIADMDPQPEGIRYLDTENAAVKVLNDTTLDKNFVTAMTNKHKQLVMDRIQSLEAKYPDIEFIPYSDFKSFRFAFRPKPPLKELPNNFYSDVDKAFKQANKDLSDILKDNGLVNQFSDSRDWFKAGYGETADGAADLSRYSRTAPDSNYARTRDRIYTETRETDLKMAELYRGSVQSSMKGSDLLEETAMGGEFIPKAEVFDAVRKTNTVEETQEFLLKTTGNQVSLQDAKKLRTYTGMVDKFSPSLRITKRESSVLNGKYGGITIDLVGAGSKNLTETSRATAGAKTIDEVFVKARAGEKEVTALLDAKKLEVKDTVMPILKKHGINGRFVASGDDITIVPTNKPISDEIQKEIADALAATKEPSSFRMGMVGTGIRTTQDRMILATTMEDVVKKTVLKVDVPPEIRKQVFISAQTDATAVGKGQVKMIIGGKISPAIRKKYEEAFKKAIQEINEKTKSSYEP